MRKLVGIAICLILITSLIAGVVACAQQETTTEGTIRTVDEKEKTVTFDRNIVRITDTTEITLDAKKASLKDLKSGMGVVVTHKGNKAIKVEAKAVPKK